VPETEVANIHSITSSARSMRDCGIVMPSPLVVIVARSLEQTQSWFAI
jgi:hypothetical protein